MKQLLLYFFGTIILLNLPNPVLAESPTFELDQDNFLLSLPADRTLTESLIVKNLSSEQLKVMITWEKPDNISPEHTFDFAKIQNPDLKIEPYGIASTEIVFSGPEKLKAGDYYGQAKIVGGSQTKTANFTIRLLGGLKESVRINNINYGKSQIQISFQNSGNITSSVVGKLAVSNFFNQKILNKNIDQFDIKASEKLDYSIRMNSLFPGPYTVRLDYTFGDKKTPVTRLQKVWVFNYLLLIPLVSIVIAVILAFRLSLRNKNA